MRSVAGGATTCRTRARVALRPWRTRRLHALDRHFSDRVPTVIAYDPHTVETRASVANKQLSAKVREVMEEVRHEGRVAAVGGPATLDSQQRKLPIAWGMRAFYLRWALSAARILSSVSCSSHSRRNAARSRGAVT